MADNSSRGYEVVGNSSLVESVGIVHFGLGEIGIALVRATGKATGLRSVAAVEVRPECVGRTLEEVCSAGGDVVIQPTIDEASREGGNADVAFHAAGSYLEVIDSQISGLLKAGLNVVTTAEELICPQGAPAERAARLHAEAQANGVTLFPAGVNPGFLMDRLPAYVTSMTFGPRRITVRRLVNLAERRQALRRKMGVGDDARSVGRRLERRDMGHVGLVESVRYLATALGWRIGEIDETLSPIVAEGRLERAGETVEVGEVLGIEHKAGATDDSGRSITLELAMRIDVEEAIDEIEIDADPPLKLRICGGLNGDKATVASVVNAARFIRSAPPGLLRELPAPFANVY